MSQRPPLIKYPRTPHLSGSRVQHGDEDIAVATVAELRGHRVVVEEKLDGSNCAVSFDAAGRPLLQSRGRYLQGGGGEAEFQLLKTWTHLHADLLFARLSDRYVMYGEWLFAHHMIYYDRLPSYFVEFDVLDRTTGRFLDTDARAELTADLPIIVSAPVLHRGPAERLPDLRGLVVESRFRSGRWRDALAAAAADKRVPAERALDACDLSPLAEGVYVKAERDGHVVGRYKFVRDTFSQRVDALGDQWKNRPLIPNTLDPGAPPFP